MTTDNYAIVNGWLVEKGEPDCGYEPIAKIEDILKALAQVARLRATAPGASGSDEITERIYQAISDKRMFKQEVRQLAGHTESRWRRAEDRDDWRYSEAADIARVLRMPVKTLIGAP